jgi:hypothetical protein
MRNSRSLFAAGFVAASILVLLSESAALAFCRTTTCDTCVQPIVGCVTEGLPLRWGTDCASYDLQQKASEQVSLAVATNVADRSFSAWTQVICPDTGAPPSIRVLDRGPVVCDEVEYNDPNAAQSPHVGGNANIIVFRDADWEKSNESVDPKSTLALTTVTFSRSTGEIFDADIEVNSAKLLSAADPVSPESYDLQSILTHEAGHFFGLAHSREPCDGADCPTMMASYVKGSTAFRSLEIDDIRGICDVYPVGRTAAASACTPMHGFAGECGLPKPPKSGCSIVSAGGPDSGGLGVWVGLGWAFMAAVRTRRWRRSAR